MELGELLRKKALGPAIAIALVDFLSRQRSVQCVPEPSNQIFFSVIDQMSLLNAGPNFGPKLKNTPRKLELNERTLGRIEGMAMLGCTVEDIASMLNVDKKTFHKFMDDHPEARQARRHGVGMCKLSLRRAQFRHVRHTSKNDA